MENKRTNNKKRNIKEILNQAINIKHTYLLLLIVVSIGICVIYFSYAVFTVSEEKNGVLNIVTGNLYTYMESEALSSINRITVPANTTKKFDITLQNINSVDAKYNLYYKGTTSLPSTVRVGYSSIKDISPSSTGTTISKYGSTSDKLVVTAVVENKSSSSYTIEFGSSVGLNNTTLSIPSGYTSLTTIVDIPNAPVLEDKMIPVMWNGSNWVKTTLTASNYYNYSAQSWANAVIMQPCVKKGDVNGNGVLDNNNTIRNISSSPDELSDAQIILEWYTNTTTKPPNAVDLADIDGDGVVNVSDSLVVTQIVGGIVTSINGETISPKVCYSKTPNEYASAPVGTVINEGDIQSMWVWIPRFEYQYTNLGTSYAGGTKAQPGGISINFLEDTRTKVTNSNYKVHPGFQFASSEKKGFWVGKFETGFLQNGWESNWTTSGAQLSTATLEDKTNHPEYNGKYTDRMIIKPNIYSWRNISVSNMFDVAIANNARIIKNSEWGAVAYLTQSKYGKYGNTSFSGANKEVYRNSNNTYKTGCSGGLPSTASSATCYAYNSSTSGTGASSTGNIYGVYDMNGGARDYVMGNYDKELSSSGFDAMPALIYYDLYTITNMNMACNGGICYGHALSETSGWYNDGTDTLGTTYAWYTRGGYYGDTASTSGIFRTYTQNGAASSSNGYRFVYYNNE